MIITWLRRETRIKMYLTLQSILESMHKTCKAVAQSCPTLCNPMDCSLPGSSVHGISQARILKWVAISFFRGSSWPRDWTWVSSIAGRFFTTWATKEAPSNAHQRYLKPSGDSNQDPHWLWSPFITALLLFSHGKLILITIDLHTLVQTVT